MEEQILRELGFSERETKVYLALLSFGQTTVGPIASKTRIQHAKIYPTLEKLIDKGLVTFVIKSKTKYFEAQSPKFILSILKEKEKTFNEILPTLLQKQQFSAYPQTAKIYEGTPAIKGMFESLILEMHHKSFYYAFAFKEEYINSPPASNFLREIHLALTEKNIDVRLIAHESIKKEVIRNYQEIKHTKIRLTTINLPLGLIITENKIINWVWGKRPTAIEINSKQIAEQYKKFFYDIWDKASRIRRYEASGES